MVMGDSKFEDITVARYNLQDSFPKRTKPWLPWLAIILELLFCVHNPLDKMPAFVYLYYEAGL